MPRRTIPGRNAYGSGRHFSWAIEPPVYTYLQSYSQRDDAPPGRLYLSAGTEGEVETELAAGVECLTDRLEVLDPPQLRWTVRSFEGESHPSVVPQALVDGLITVFSDVSTAARSAASTTSPASPGPWD